MFDPVDDTSNYKWGVFYYNRQDDRFIVPKRIRPMGFTFNFAHPYASVIIAALLLVIFLLSQR